MSAVDLDSKTRSYSASQYLLDTAKTAHHSCGTRAMRPYDQGGVVDSKLTVWGTKNVRVVDSSVFHSLPVAISCRPSMQWPRRLQI